MNKAARDVGFWVAVALAGALGSSVLKLVAARFELPAGLEAWIATT